MTCYSCIVGHSQPDLYQELGGFAGNAAGGINAPSRKPIPSPGLPRGSAENPCPRRPVPLLRCLLGTTRTDLPSSWKLARTTESSLKDVGEDPGARFEAGRGGRYPRPLVRPTRSSSRAIRVRSSARSGHATARPLPRQPSSTADDLACRPWDYAHAFGQIDHGRGGTSMALILRSSISS